jgi:hypothetical protein
LIIITFIAVGGETANFRKLRRIVDEEADFLAVVLSKMLFYYLERLIHVLANGGGRRNDNVFAPAVTPVEFAHRLDVGVGLARAGFHLRSQVEAAIEGIGGLYLTCPLNGADML